VPHDPLFGPDSGTAAIGFFFIAVPVIFIVVKVIIRRYGASRAQKEQEE
jgi:hypothetical protein